MIRTLVIAPSLIARVALAEIVRADARLALAGEAHGDDLGARVRALEPDVVLEDRDEPVAALALAGDAGIASVTLVDDPALAWSHDLARGDVAGARAVLPRDAAPSEIVAAIVAVAAGLIALSPRALASDAARGRDGIHHTATTVERLTPRETGVLRELARGIPNKTIAARLGISEHTVKFHVAAIFAKLGVASRTEAVARGIRLGLIMV